MLTASSDRKNSKKQVSKKKFKFGLISDELVVLFFLKKDHIFCKGSEAYVVTCMYLHYTCGNIIYTYTCRMFMFFDVEMYAYKRGC